MQLKPTAHDEHGMQLRELLRMPTTWKASGLQFWAASSQKRATLECIA